MRQLLVTTMASIVCVGTAHAQSAPTDGGLVQTQAAPAAARFIPPGAPEDIPVEDRLAAIQARRRGLLSRDEAVQVNTIVGGVELAAGIPLVIIYRHSFRNRQVETEYLNAEKLRLMRHRDAASNIAGLSELEAREIAQQYLKTIGEPAASRVHPVMAPAVQVLRFSTRPVYRRGNHIVLEFNNHALLSNGVDIMQRIERESPEAMQAIRRLTKEQLDTFNRAARNWQTDRDPNSRLQLHKFFEEGTPEYNFLKGLEDARRGFPNLADAPQGSASLDRIPQQYRDVYRKGYNLIPDAPHTANLTIRERTLKLHIPARGLAEATLTQAIRQAAEQDGGRSLIRAGTPQRILNRAQTAGLVLIVANGVANLITAANEVASGRIEYGPHEDFCGQDYCWDHDGVIRYPLLLISASGLLELGYTPFREDDPAPPEAPPASPALLGRSAN